MRALQRCDALFKGVRLTALVFELLLCVAQNNPVFAELHPQLVVFVLFIGQHSLERLDLSQELRRLRLGIALQSLQLIRQFLNGQGVAQFLLLFQHDLLLKLESESLHERVEHDVAVLAQLESRLDSAELLL